MHRNLIHFGLAPSLLLHGCNAAQWLVFLLALVANAFSKGANYGEEKYVTKSASNSANRGHFNLVYYHTRPCAYQRCQGSAYKVCETHRLRSSDRNAQVKVNTHCHIAFCSYQRITSRWHNHSDGNRWFHQISSILDINCRINSQLWNENRYIFHHVNEYTLCILNKHVW